LNYTITIEHDLKLIKYKHDGLLEAKDIGYVWENELLKMKEFTQMEYNLFSDYSDAKLKIPTSFLPELMTFMKKIRFIVEGKKQSIIVADPYSTAASLIFENEVIKEAGFEVKVFSTKEAAFNWITS